MWINFKVNIQNIEAETANAILIKVPKNAKHGDFCFWVSKKCVRDGSHSYEIVVGVNDERPVTLKRTGKNFKVLEERQVTAQELQESFKGRA